MVVLCSLCDSGKISVPFCLCDDYPCGFHGDVMVPCDACGGMGFMRETDEPAPEVVVQQSEVEGEYLQ